MSNTWRGSSKSPRHPVPVRCIGRIGGAAVECLGLPIRRVVIALDDFACRIGQCARAAQGVGQEVGPLAAFVARKALVDARAGQDGVDRIALALLHDVHAVVEVGRGLPAFGLADAAAQCVHWKMCLPLH